MPSPAAVPLAPLMRSLNIEKPLSQPTQKPNVPHRYPSADSLEIGDGLTRAQDLWFQDCGLIIQAEDTIFRVSGTILAVQSTVFRDMLSLPIPEAADTIDGCPFVLLPDSAEDTGNFLARCSESATGM
jgi:hypothetical protein